MNMLKLVISFICCFIVTSCGKTIKLADEDFKWIPYKGSEILVFNSNTGDSDTLFLLGVGRESVPSDPLDFFPTKLDHFSIGAKHSDPSPPSGNHRYLESDFLNLSVGEDKEPYLSIHFTAKNAWFYGGSFLDLKDLDTIKQVTLDTKAKRFTDIIIIRPESDEYYDRSNFITNLYWSKSQGLIRYDKKDGSYWELTNKYSP
jgi:hypothetical protein